ncbi:MAG: hypothetical protein LWW95_05995 [Candidatus Desulfofervidus auxilii]|nr:hypothetical protein [Candidatus Desulfofervidus auxilii]
MKRKILLAVLFKKIETLFEAATYAEAGAFEIAREVLEKETDKEALLYAENLGKRIGAEIEILYVIKPSKRKTLKGKLKKLFYYFTKKIIPNANLSIGNLEEEIANYVKTHNEILFTIVSERDIKTLQKCKELNCPLIVIKPKS